MHTHTQVLARKNVKVADFLSAMDKSGDGILSKVRREYLSLTPLASSPHVYSSAVQLHRLSPLSALAIRPP